MVLTTAVSTMPEPPRRLIAIDALEVETMTKAGVASLMPRDIRRMNCEQLAEAVRASDLPLQQPQIDTMLEFSDRQELELNVYLARRCCRNQGY